MTSLQVVSLAEARRISLAAQGFALPRARGPVTAAEVSRAIRRLGVLQLDYVNVLVPAHYLVLFSRLGPYSRSLLDRVVYQRREFIEQWAHEASIVPVEHWPLFRHRRATHRPRPWGFERFLAAQPDYVEQVVETVRGRGPLSAAELPAAEGVPRRIPWGDAWVGTVPRATLEALFGSGVLAIAGRRPDFSRTYDLAERVIPPRHYARDVELAEAGREMIRNAARCYGIATADDLADYYRMPARTAREHIAELVHAGELRPVRVEGWRAVAFLHPAAEIPRRVDTRAVLSPFDPLVWYRPRAERLFDFEYRIEIYTPKEKRRWGYYVLPFLLGDRIVARVDLKAERAAGRLAVLATHLEPHADARKVRTALGAELDRLTGWLGLEKRDRIRL